MPNSKNLRKLGKLCPVRLLMWYSPGHNHKVQQIVHTTCKYTAINWLCTPSFWKPSKVLYANIPLLFFVYSDFAFFIGRELFCFFIYFNLLPWMSRQCLIVLLFLMSWWNLLYYHNSCYRFSFFHFIFCAFVYCLASLNMQMIHRIYDDSKSSLEAAICSWAILY